MNDFKVGDRVEYVGPNLRIKQLGALTVTNVTDGGIVEVNDQGWTAIYYRSLRHVPPAPDVLTIPRAELPEVVEVEEGFRVNNSTYGLMLDAAWHRKHALAQLAVSEFLATREKAEQEAADQHAAILNKRRDELAVEVAKAAGFIDFKDFTYKEHLPSAQAAINMLIEREGEVKK